jgi:UDP-N-acetylmuramoylalanine--D-glutamate ligase
LKIDALAGARVTVMGLGVNGGGLPTALYFARHGATVTVTDLRAPGALKESMDRLGGVPVRYVLGRHEEADFTGADIVIKNPAVAPTSPYLAAARAAGAAVETDLSVFLTVAKNPVIAVTGSKGKSTTSSAIAFALARVFHGTRLGGNITVSPLAFVDELSPRDPVVLELSSWQLGDLRGRGLLKPSVAVFTVILPDHLDKYGSMEPYVADKKVLFQEQEPGQHAVFNGDDPWQASFPGETRARSLVYSASRLPDTACGAWLDGDDGLVRLSPGEQPRQVLGATRVPGRHNRMNLLCAGLALCAFGVKPEAARRGLAEFPGIEHRLELVREWRGIRFYNDSAATIPHATVEALKSLPRPVILLTGGTDKNIDFSPLAAVAREPAAILMLAGSGTDKMRPVLVNAGARPEGPYASLKEAVVAAVEQAQAAAGMGGGGTGTAAEAAGGAVSLLFSPGCTSFGMFLNEFDRGRQFKAIVEELTEGDGASPSRATASSP